MDYSDDPVPVICVGGRWKGETEITVLNSWQWLMFVLNTGLLSFLSAVLVVVVIVSVGCTCNGFSWLYL